MKRDEIIAKWESLSPRERDAWVAEVVFGIKARYEYSPDGPIYLDMSEKGRRHIRYFTTDISAAWAAIEKAHEWGGMDIGCYGKAGAKFYVVHTYEDLDNTVARGITVTKETAPEAICLASIIAKLAEARAQ